MKKFYVTFSLLAALATATAQEDMSFEPSGLGANYTWNVFENDVNPPLEFVANPNPSGANTSATVAKFTALVTGNPWAGTETTHDDAGGMPNFVLDADHSIIKIMVYKSVISPVGIKLATPSGGALVEKKISNTLINQWEELTFDFTDYIGAALPDNGEYDQVIVFPDFTNGPRPATTVVYFDNIVFGDSEIVDGPAATEPLTPAPDPTVPAEDVISMFSGVYTNVPVNTWQTTWSQGTLTDIQIQGNATKKYTNLSFVGVEAVGPNSIDATDMTHFNVNVWSADFTQLRIKLVDFGADNAFGGGDDVEHEVTYNTPAQSTWLTYSIPFSSFPGLVTREHISQLIFSSNGTSTVYIDNVFFSAGEDNPVVTEPLTAAPDPTLPQAQVISMFSGVYNNVPVNTWKTDWSAATYQEVQIQGNPTKKYSGLNFVGIETVGANSIDATDMTHFNVDVWSANFPLFKIKLVDFGADNAFGGGDDVEHEMVYENPAPAQGEWITYNIPLSAMTGLTTREHISQLIFATADGTSTVFVDNVYFSNEDISGVADFNAGKVAVYPNPAKDVLTVQAAKVIENVVVYNIYGQEVLRSAPGATATTINVAQLQSGIYMVTATTDGATATQKFIKQ